jgi:hypothetical protein
MNHPIIGGVNSDPDMLTIENVIIKIILNQGLMMSLFEEICKKHQETSLLIQFPEDV